MGEAQTPWDSPAATVSKTKHVKNEEMLKRKEREMQMLEKKTETKKIPTTTKKQK